MYLYNKRVPGFGVFGLWEPPLTRKPSRKWGSELLGPPKGRYGRHLRRCAALLGPAALHMDLSAAFWAPFWDPPDTKICAPVEARASISENPCSGAKSGPRARKVAPRASQESPRGLQEGPKSCQQRPNSCQEGSRSSPRAGQEASKSDLGLRLPPTRALGGSRALFGEDFLGI